MSGAVISFLRGSSNRRGQNWPAVLKIKEVRRILINRDALVCNVTLDGENWRGVQPKVADFLRTLPAAGHTHTAWTPAPLTGSEGLTIPAQVNYVGKGANLFDLGYTRHGSLEVITNYLRTTWLWEKIRIQGGAYGVFCIADPHSGVFTYLSYRDPNVLTTLKNYDGASAFLRNLDLSTEELVKGIIGASARSMPTSCPTQKGITR